MENLTVIVIVFLVILIMKLKWDNYKLHQMVRRDGQTGLYNRYSLSLLGDKLFKITSKKNTITVVYFDADGFKSANDMYGHSRVNAWLAAFATAISAVVWPEDVLARLHGDEFGAILQGGEKALIGFTTKIRASEKEAEIQTGLKIHFSVGAAVKSADDVDVYALDSCGRLCRLPKGYTADSFADLLALADRPGVSSSKERRGEARRS